MASKPSKASPCTGTQVKETCTLVSYSSTLLYPDTARTSINSEDLQVLAQQLATKQYFRLKVRMLETVSALLFLILPCPEGVPEKLASQGRKPCPSKQKTPALAIPFLELDSMNLMGLFQLRAFYDSIIQSQNNKVLLVYSLSIMQHFCAMGSHAPKGYEEVVTYFSEI